MTSKKKMLSFILLLSICVIQCNISCKSGSIFPKEKTGQIDREKIVKAQANIESFIHRFGARDYFPTFAIAVVVGDSMVYHHCYRTNIHRTYSLASVTKIFTALAIMQLVEEGLIDLDTPISEYLTGVEIAKPELGSSRITVRHLLSHSSGLPDVRYFRPPYRSRSNGINLHGKELKVPGQVVPAGRHYRYANYGFMLLGLLVERVTGIPYREYIQKHIYNPIGMEDAKTSKKLSGAGGVIVSMQDMSRFASMWLREGKSITGKRIIDDDAIGQMLEQQLYIPHAKVKRYVGLGWRARRDEKGILTFFHIGGATHVSAWLQVFPRYNCAVIYLGNPTEYTPQLMYFLTSMQHRLARLATLTVGAEKSVNSFNPTMPTKNIMHQYTGVYKSPINDTIAHVYMKDGNLYMSNSKESIKLHPYSSHIFQGGRNMISYDFVHRPDLEKPDGLATFYDYF